MKRSVQRWARASSIGAMPPAARPHDSPVICTPGRGRRSEATMITARPVEVGVVGCRSDG
jgi:hypothetical protein